MKFRNQGSEDEVETLIAVMSKLPGLGPRSARRAVIRMIEKRKTILEPLVTILNLISENISECKECGNFSAKTFCSICSDNSRKKNILCIRMFFFFQLVLY